MDNNKSKNSMGTKDKQNYLKIYFFKQQKKTTKLR